MKEAEESIKQISRGGSVEGERCWQKEEQEQSPRLERVLVTFRAPVGPVGEMLRWPQVRRGKTVEVTPPL